MFKRILLCVAVVAVAAALLAIFLQKSPMVQTFKKPDGTVVTFIDVSYGTNQTIVQGPSFSQWLYKVLPKPVKSWSGASVLKYATTQTNVPTFWVLETKPKRDDGPQAGSPPLEQFLRVVDEYGCEYDPEGWNMGTSSEDGHRSISRYAIDAGDPHGKIVGLCFYDSPEKKKQLGRLTIPGTTITNIAEPEQPVAAAQQDGEFMFQLMSLTTGLKSTPYTYGVPKQKVFTQAILKIANNGVPVPNWFPVSVSVTDRHGKKTAIQRQGHGEKNGNAAFDFEGALDPAAGPFKLRFEFTHWEGFAPEELVTIKDVPFAAKSEILSPRLNIRAKGRQLLLEKIYGAYSERPYDSFQTIQPLIQLRLEPEGGPTHVLLMRAVDEEGKEIGRWGGGAMGDGKYCFSFAPTSKAKTMTLTFAVYESRFAEFEAMPVVFRTDGTTK